MIQFTDVSKSYGEIRALQDVSLQVAPGEILGYIGPNGAGKTTTIKILTGLVGSYSGLVSIHGRDIRSDPASAQRLIGYVPQDAGFQEWRTVEHALHTFGRLSGMGSRDLSLRIQDVLETVGMAGARRRKIAHLSGGMIQKIRIAQALLHEPSILVLDEPLSGLDPEGRRELRDLISREAARGRAVLISSHILNDIENVATKIAILRSGRIMRCGSPEELREQFRIGHELRLRTADAEPGPWQSLGCLESFETSDSGETQSLRLKPGVDLDESIAEVLKAALGAGVRIRSFELSRPSLEDVYLHYMKGEQ